MNVTAWTNSSAAAIPQRGFSLIEVLIALLVLSVGLLGLAMLQIQGFRFNTNSYQRTQATMLANDIIDRIRANKAGSDAGAYCLTITAPADPCGTTIVPGANNCGSAGGCTTIQDLAHYDITSWYDLQAKYLANSGPGAVVSSIMRRSGPAGPSGTTSIFTYTITINWMERDLPMQQVWVVQI
jgi:type IV pilus assembly protein PilV